MELEEYYEFLSAVDIIVSEASKYKTDYEKIKYVYDWFTHKVSYNYRTLTGVFEYYDPDAWTTYGAIVNKHAVCQGIAFGFELVMHRLGYECVMVTGSDLGSDEVNHIWNILLLDGKEYYFDATWDCKRDKFAPNTYFYFFLTKSEMMRDHKFEDEYDTGCETEFVNEYDFYRNENAYLEEYSYEEITKLIDRDYENGVVYFKFYTFYDFIIAYREIDKIKNYFCDKIGTDHVFTYYGQSTYSMCVYCSELALEKYNSRKAAS